MIGEMTGAEAKPSRNPTVAKPMAGKQRIIEAAERLFALRGFMEVSASDIAREAGVAHGLLFHHFGSMEDLYAAVSRAAAERMNEAQARSFRGATARDQIASFLRAHVRMVKQRSGDAIFRSRAQNLAINNQVAEIWEASRLTAILRLCEVMGMPNPDKNVRACLRAWIAFHDQLVIAWLADRSISESQVLDWTLQQLDHLCADVLHVDIHRPL